MLLLETQYSWTFIILAVVGLFFWLRFHWRG